MKSVIILYLIFAGMYFVKCEHLIMGDANNKHLVYHMTAQYHYIPLTKRVKDVFFSSPDLRPINAIMAYDNLHSKASASITAGGLGSTYVNIRLKSERGMGLDYDIGIYSNERQIVSGARHNTECGVTSEANWRRQHAFSVDSAPADSGGIGSTLVDWSK